jgi:hypothetical protein
MVDCGDVYASLRLRSTGEWRGQLLAGLYAGNCRPDRFSELPTPASRDSFLRDIEGAGLDFPLRGTRNTLSVGSSRTHHEIAG